MTFFSGTLSFIVNVDEIPPLVHSPDIETDQTLSEINVYWDTDFLDFVSFVDVVVFGYDEVDDVIVFEPIFTLGEGINYELGYMSFPMSPQDTSFEVGVIAVVESNTIGQQQGYKI